MSDFHPVVEWTGPNGNSVHNTSSIAVNAPLYDGNKTYVLLRFPALRTSQAGSYTCLSIINSPLSVKTATKDVVVTGKRHCKYYTRCWNHSDTLAMSAHRVKGNHFSLVH